jgi:hypothetical protein
MGWRSALYRPRIGWLGLATGVALVLLGGCAAQPATAQGADSSRSGVSWSDAKLVKNVIVGYLGIRAENDALAANSGFGSDVIDLLLLFDSWDGPEDVRALASLGSYYLGAHGGETYSCLVVRKGLAILPELKRQIEGHPTECSPRYGGSTDICLSEERRNSRLQEMIKRIEAGQTCAVER